MTAPNWHQQPPLINDLLCLPEDFDHVVGLMAPPSRTPREFHTLKQYGVFGDSIEELAVATPDE